MTSYPMLYTDNANSWRRIMMLARLYWPGMRPGFIVCALVPFLLFIISSALLKFTGFLPETVIFWVLSLLFYLSPLMLTRRDYREVSSQLPVTATEKIGFLYLTFGLAVPLLIIASSAAGQLAGILLFGSEVAGLYRHFQDSLIGQQLMTPLLPTGIAILVNSISFLSVLTIVLYFVVKARRNRMLAAFLSFFITIISLAFIAGAMGAVIGFIHGWNAARQHLDITPEQMSAIMESLVKWVTTTEIVLTMIVAAIFYRKLYKRLRNSGF